MLILLACLGSFGQPRVGESIVVSDHVAVASVGYVRRVAARAFVGGTTRREESARLHETLDVTADSVRLLGEDVAVVGQFAMIAPVGWCLAGCSRYIRGWIRVVQLPRVVLIRIGTSWQGFVGFLQVRQSPRQRGLILPCLRVVWIHLVQLFPLGLRHAAHHETQPAHGDRRVEPERSVKTERLKSSFVN